MKEKWYEYWPGAMYKEILRSRQVTKHEHPTIFFIDKENSNSGIIDFAVTYDMKVNSIETEKDIAGALINLWNRAVEAIPVVISALEKPSKNLKEQLEEIGSEANISGFMKTAIKFLRYKESC